MPCALVALQLAVNRLPMLRCRTHCAAAACERRHSDVTGRCWRMGRYSGSLCQKQADLRSEIVAGGAGAQGQWRPGAAGDLLLKLDDTAF